MDEPGRKRASLAVGANDVDAQVAILRQRLLRGGAVKLSMLKPAALRGRLAQRLAAEGFELTTTFIRRPLAAQLLDVLSREEAIAVRTLPDRLQGASRAEIAQVVELALARGELRRILRGREEFVAGARHAVLGEQRLAALRRTLSDLAKMLDRASKKKNVGLLASDIEQMLSAARRVLEEDTAPRATGVAAPVPLIAPTPGMKPRTPAAKPRTPPAVVAPEVVEPIPVVSPASPVPPAAVAPELELTRAGSAGALARLMAAVDAARDERTGMSFVPAVVHRLSADMSVSAALDALMAAARRELIELRPEGGLSRLSDEELALCPPGPSGTRLSWARRNTGVAA